MSREASNSTVIDGCSIYKIPHKAIVKVVEILQSYGNLKPSCEGIAYLAGRIDNGIQDVKMVVAPNAIASPMRVVTDHRANAEYVRLLSDVKLIHIGQVHSHPGKWVGHSEGDDIWTPFKAEGLLSIVAPYYGSVGMLPWKICGVHQFKAEKFIRLSTADINNYLQTTINEIAFYDLR